MDKKNNEKNNIKDIIGPMNQAIVASIAHGSRINNVDDDMMITLKSHLEKFPKEYNRNIKTISPEGNIKLKKKNVKRYFVTIDGENIYINGELHHFSTDMDKTNREDDLNKKALLALACEMGYEATYLFEEMVDRLYEMLKEV